MNQKQREALYEKDIEKLENKSAINDVNRKHIEGTHRYFCQAGEYDVIDMFLQKDTVAIDLGANEGQISIKLAPTCRQCIAVEPVKPIENLKDLLPTNCDLLEVAVGEETGYEIIKTPVVNGEPAYGLSSFRDLSIIPHYKEFEEKEVEIRTVDQIVSKSYRDEEIGFIKIDVEGYELRIPGHADQ